MPPTPLVYTVEEIAELFHVSRRHAYEMVKTGQLPHLKLGARILIPCEAVDAMLGKVVQRFIDQTSAARAGE